VKEAGLLEQRLRISYCVRYGIVGLGLLLGVQSSVWALFSDDEARRAILDLRNRVEQQGQQTQQSNQQHTLRTEQLEQAFKQQMSQLSDIHKNQDGQTKRQLLDINNALEAIRSELMKLQGQFEVLTNDLVTTQRSQRDFYKDIDGRLRKLEPQPTVIDGKEVLIEPTEQKSFDAALAKFKASEFKETIIQLEAFNKTWNKSSLMPQSLFALGSSYYVQKDYKRAIVTMQNLIKQFPEHVRVPDALLNIAQSHFEMGDKSASKKALELLLDKHPASPAASIAKERLAALKS
jgi:tol-pal system protein YbgF